MEIPLAAEMTDDDIDRAIRMHEGGVGWRGDGRGRGEVATATDVISMMTKLWLFGFI